MLVLTGAAGPAEGTVADEIARLGLTDQVRRTGRIPAVDVNGLYDEAAMTVIPSRYEGFGIPALEAMRRGCPVVAARATALPEVVGDAATLVDPDDIDGWVAASRRGPDRPPSAAKRWSSRDGHERPTSVPSEPRPALLAAYRLATEVSRSVKFVVVCPHFAPDVAPTGEVMTKIVEQLTARWAPHRRDHVAPVVRAPRGRARVPRQGGPHRDGVMGEDHPRPSVSDRQARHPTTRPRLRRLQRPGLGRRCRGQSSRRRARHVTAPHARAHRMEHRGRVRRAPMVFNIQDVFPDVAIELGVLKGKRVIAAAKWLERLTYARRRRRDRAV